MRRTTSLALAVFALTAARAARAQSYALDFARKDGATACPARQALVEQVGKRLGRDPFVGSSPERFGVVLSGGAGSWRAVMTVSSGGTQHGRQVIESSEADCTALFGAVVAAASVMLHGPPDGEPAAAAAKPSPSGPAPSVEPEPSAKPEPSSEPAAAATALRPAPEPRPARVSAAFDRFTLGVEVAQDLTLVPSASNVCAQDRYTCYHAGTDRRFDGAPSPGRGNKFRGGLDFGAHRLLVTFSWALGPRFALDARAGGAFGDVGPGFPPWHVELGARRWLGGPGAAVRGYVAASAGYARVDVKAPLTLRDCAATGTPTAACLDGTAPDQPDQLVTVDSVDRLGPLFVAARLGFVWSFAAHNSVGLALAASVPFPRARLVLWPSAAYSVGF